MRLMLHAPLIIATVPHLLSKSNYLTQIEDEVRQEIEGSFDVDIEIKSWLRRALQMLNSENLAVYLILLWFSSLRFQ
jgi:hypothetical protein